MYMYILQQSLNKQKSAQLYQNISKRMQKQEKTKHRPHFLTSDVASLFAYKWIFISNNYGNIASCELPALGEYPSTLHKFQPHSHIFSPCQTRVLVGPKFAKACEACGNSCKVFPPVQKQTGVTWQSEYLAISFTNHLGIILHHPK